MNNITFWLWRAYHKGLKSLNLYCFHRLEEEHKYIVSKIFFLFG